MRTWTSRTAAERLGLSKRQFLRYVQPALGRKPKTHGNLYRTDDLARIKAYREQLKAQPRKIYRKEDRPRWKRICKNGHDKSLPNGLYIVDHPLDNGGIWTEYRCAVCDRLRGIARYHKNKDEVQTL